MNENTNLIDEHNEELTPIEELSPFKRIVLSLGTLPSAFYNTMTYYESLVYFYEYLKNEVIPTVNNNGQAVEELQEKYLELKSYVDTYFENLDVQEEINNKLDEMAENGSLLSLIENYIDPFITSQNEEITSFKNEVNNQLQLQSNLINALNITPLTASSTSGMTDTSRIYVNTTDGYWYYYDGDSWEQGGLYQSDGIDNITYNELDANLKSFVDKYIDYSSIFVNPIASNITTTKSGDLFTSLITSQNYEHGYQELNENLYLYSNFTLYNVPTSPTAGLIVGYVNNDKNNYLMMIVSQGQSGSIYHINNGSNLGKVGTYDNRRNVKNIEIISLVSKVLTFKITTLDNSILTDTYDLTSITNSITPIIGFATFTTNPTTFNYKLSLYPFIDYTTLNNKIDSFISANTTALDEILIDGIKNGDSLTIKLLGDSITAGYGGTNYSDSYQAGAVELFWGRYQNLSGYCWANNLKNYVESKYSNITVKNYGVSGANVYNLVQYYDSVPLVDTNDDIVIVMIGTNDRDGTKANFINNLLTLCDKILDSGKKVILMTSIPASISNELTHTLHMEDIAMYNESVAIFKNIPFINLYEEFNKYCINTNTTIDSLLSDGLHPNDNGYRVMFEIVSNKLGFMTKRPDATW